MTQRALTISRFQPFHLGHYRTIKKMKEDGYEEIVVGIGSAEKSYRPDNPFTCSERTEMIHAVLKNEGFKHYFLIPIRDIDDYDLWVCHAERLSPKFEVVYTGNPLTVELFRRANYNVIKGERDIIQDFSKNPVETINVSGTTIREMIVNNNQRWKDLVPAQVHEKILEFDGVERIRKLFSIRDDE